MKKSRSRYPQLILFSLETIRRLTVREQFNIMKRWMGGLVLMGYTIVIGVGVAYSQRSSGNSSSAQEALEKGNAASDSKNTEEAKKWWRIAANQGNAEAQWHLGRH
jgi:hypothetical protein